MARSHYELENVMFGFLIFREKETPCSYFLQDKSIAAKAGSMAEATDKVIYSDGHLAIYAKNSTSARSSWALDGLMEKRKEIITHNTVAFAGAVLLTLLNLYFLLAGQDPAPFYSWLMFFTGTAFYLNYSLFCAGELYDYMKNRQDAVHYKRTGLKDALFRTGAFAEKLLSLCFLALCLFLISRGQVLISMFLLIFFFIEPLLRHSSRAGFLYMTYRLGFYANMASILFLNW